MDCIGGRIMIGIKKKMIKSELAKEKKKIITERTDKKLSDAQVASMLNIIADKHGARLALIDLSQHWVEVECPESSKVACSVEMGEFLQSLENVLF